MSCADGASVVDSDNDSVHLDITPFVTWSKAPAYSAKFTSTAPLYYIGWMPLKRLIFIWPLLIAHHYTFGYQSIIKCTMLISVRALSWQLPKDGWLTQFSWCFFYHLSILSLCCYCKLCHYVYTVRKLPAWIVRQFGADDGKGWLSDTLVMGV